MPAAANRAPRTEAPGGRSYLAELGEGLRFIRAHTVLLSMILIATVGNFLDKPLMAVILPVYAKTIYDSPTSLGLAIGAFGAGALTGSLVFGAIGRGWPRRITFLSCWVLGPLVIFGFLALTPPLGVLVIAGFVGGLLFGPINPIASTVIQEHTPSELLGRVFGALTALAQAGIPIGAVLAGVIVQRAGLVPNGGRPVKLLGDGVMFHFPEPAQGVLCGLELVDRIPRVGLPRARVGLHTGPLVFQNGDYFGRTVNIAARITDYARPGEVLVSDAVVAATDGLQAVRYEPVGPVSLKGLTAPITLYTTVRAD